MNERRELARRRVCLGGLIETAAFLPAIACTVRDVSLGGARVRVEPDAILPGSVLLHVPKRGECRAARLVWRQGDAAGFRFSDEVGRADRNVSETEAENERLRAALLVRSNASLH